MAKCSVRTVFHVRAGSHEAAEAVKELRARSTNAKSTPGSNPGC
jgi:hypothetical protein